MAILITFDPKKVSFNKETKTFQMSERDVKFATTYELLNPKTGKSDIFEFSHSTGPEFDINTKYVYASLLGCTLEVCNDAYITNISKRNYIQKKLNS